MKKRITPAVKWAGGKTQLLPHILNNLPAQYKQYYEPFLGGGAVLLGVQPKSAKANDINPQLVNLYKQIKSASDSVIAKVRELDSEPCTKELYLLVRERYNKKIKDSALDAECAALMIWVNKHCFNGLYRVNSKGLFNVPYNNRVNGKSIDEDNLRAISEYLQEVDVEITCLDFEEALVDVQADDFVYFDSPYIPESITASFTSYAAGGFSLEEHERLARLFKRLDGKGAKLMLSNNNVPLVHKLYEGYNIKTLDVKRMINRNASKRTGKEVIIKNY